MSDDQPLVLYDAEAAARSKRVCGDCQLCCKLLPVRAIDKAGFTRCQHQRVNKGCGVYHDPRAMPFECSLWSCNWLTGMGTEGMRRPDRAHYVIDPMPDMIRREVNGVGEEIMVVQVWVDPAFPDAQRDPALRTYIAQRAERDNMPTLLRLGPEKALLVVAPSMTTDGQWHEQFSGYTEGYENRFVNMLGGKLAG
jgi:hypothetical protein